MTADRKLPESMKITDYWKEVASLVEEFKGREKDIKSEEDRAAFNLTMEVLQALATDGVKLEAAYNLYTPGNRMIAAKGKFPEAKHQPASALPNPDKPKEKPKAKIRIPPIQGPVSYDLAVRYQKLLEYFGQQKVTTTYKLLGSGLTSEMGQPRSGYVDAAESAEALKKAIADYAQEHTAELKASPPAAATKPSEGKEEEVQAASGQPQSPPPAVSAEETKTSEPKTALQQIRDGETPMLTVTQYWQAVLDLIQDLRQREAAGEFGTPEEVKEDKAYQEAMENFKYMAELGVTLEDPKTWVTSTLGKMGYTRIKFGKTEGQSVPKITGPASYAFVESYLPLVAYFGRSWSLSEKPEEDKSIEEKERVRTTIGDLQTAFREPRKFMRQQIDPVYKDAAMDEAVLKKILAQNQQFKPKSKEEKETPAQPAEADEIKSSAPLADQIAERKLAVQQKFDQASQARDAIQRELKIFRHLSGQFVEMKDRVTEVPSMPTIASGNPQSLSSAIDELKKSDALAQLSTEMKQYEGKQGEDKLRGQIEAVLKDWHDVQVPRQSSPDIYEELKGSLSQTSRDAWEKSSWAPTEGIYRRRLAGILAAELSSRAKSIHRQVTTLGHISVEQDMKSLARLDERQAVETAIIDFKEEAKRGDVTYAAVETYLERKHSAQTIQQTTLLLRDLNNLKPAEPAEGKEEKKALPMAKFGEMKDVTLSDIHRLVYQTACTEVSKLLLRGNPQQSEVNELRGALTSAHAIILQPNNPNALAMLTATIDILAKKKTKGKFMEGAWMMLKGFVTKNEDTYRQGWALRTGYDVGQYNIVIAKTQVAMFQKQAERTAKAAAKKHPSKPVQKAGKSK